MITNLLTSLIENIGSPFNGELSILQYHRVIDTTQYDQISTIAVSSDRFAEQSEYLSKNYNCLDLIEAMERLTTNSLPKRAVAITFDDGYRDNLTVALPILERFNLPATIFLTTGFLDGRSKATWEDETQENLFLSTGDIPTLKNNRLITLGAHTLSHRVLSALSPEEAEEEIQGGKEELEELLKEPVPIFSYPFGKRKEASKREFRLAKEAGYDYAFTSEFDHVQKDSDPYSIPRLYIGPEDDLNGFRRKLTGLSALRRNLLNKTR